MKRDVSAVDLQVHGIVQGVGFRPFVYRLAQKAEVAGTVSNTSSGVNIHVEGPQGRIDTFRSGLNHSSPPLAHITDIEETPAAPCGLEDFRILPSRGDTRSATFISPDVSVCEACLEEMRNSADRRFRYPFINCTHCGPRYTLIEQIPYDRPNTAMKIFTMCPRCQSEYDDPASRRFHAQPNACPDCGPRVSLLDGQGRPVPGDPVQRTISLLEQGALVAIKGLGGFHLAVDAQNDGAVKTLRQRKQRPHKPLALMSPSLAAVARYARVSAREAALLTGRQRPIVLLEKHTEFPLSDEVAPGNRYIGVMLPYTPLHHLLLESTFTALVMTSGNRTGEPLCIDNEAALSALGGIADYFLMHDRPIYQRNDDSLVQVTDTGPHFIRRARGYVPMPIALTRPLPPTLACGAELKSTVCLARDETAFVSQHIGDLEAAATLDFFESTIAHLKKVTGIDPQLLVHDLHPDYLSSRYALAVPGIQRIGVQHHHAHVVSCMAEQGIDGPVIGLALDGTGLGPDGTLWGGEALIAERARFTRAAHLAPVPMPGGEAAIREPWRMAVSYLHHGFGEALFSLENLPLFRKIDRQRCRWVLELISKGINAPLTSSAGRLFDGVAALCGLIYRISFEGQAAMILEAMAGDDAGDTKTPYEWASVRQGDEREIQIAPLIRQVAMDLATGVRPEEVSRRFHGTLIRMWGDLCVDLRRETGLDHVVMSGGVFQNRCLAAGLSAYLTRLGFRVHTHGKVPANDGGLSLGQAVIAGALAA